MDNTILGVKVRQNYSYVKYFLAEKNLLESAFLMLWWLSFLCVCDLILHLFHLKRNVIKSSSLCDIRKRKEKRQQYQNNISKATEYIKWYFSWSHQIEREKNIEHSVCTAITNVWNKKSVLESEIQVSAHKTKYQIW